MILELIKLTMDALTIFLIGIVWVAMGYIVFMPIYLLTKKEN